MKEIVLALVRGCPIAGCFVHFLGRSAHLHHVFTRFSSARHTHPACAKGIGTQEGVGVPWGSGVAPQTPEPLYPIGQQRCFWMPAMGVFGLHNVKKYRLGSWVAPQTHIPLYPVDQQRCFGCLGWGCLNCTMAKNIVWVLGWRPKPPYHCTP